MSDPRAWLRLAHWFARKYPSALRDLVTDLLALPDADARRERRDQSLARFLRARGERNVSPSTASRRVSQMWRRPNDLLVLLADAHAVTLIELCELWLERSPPRADGQEASATTAVDAAPPPSAHEIEAGHFAVAAEGAPNTRAAVLALICTRRLRADSRPRTSPPPTLKEPIAEQDDPAGEPGPIEPGGAWMFQSNVLNQMLDTLRGLPPDDPAWGEFEAWLDAARGLASTAASERSALQARARVVDLLARWRQEHGARTKHLRHEVPAGEQIPSEGASLAALEAAVARVFDALQRAVVLEGRLRADVDVMLELADEIAAVKRAAVTAIDDVWELLNGPGTSTDGATPPDGGPPSDGGGQVARITDVPARVAVTTPPAALAVQPVTPPPPPSSVTPPAVRAPVVPDASAEALRAHRRPHMKSSNDALLCLDFGTARSKAMGVAADESPCFLDIGVVTGSKLTHSIASSVWIDSRDGRMYFGDAAIDRSLVAGRVNQLRIDSLKDFLSASRAINGVLPDPDGKPLDRRYNPTGEPFTLGEILVLYLGYLSWATEEGARKLGLGDGVRRRFAIPSWDLAERGAGIALLRRYLARAVLVGRSVGGSWLGGIPLGEARSLARMALDLADDDLPLDLLAEGVTEPLAAVGTREDELSLRNGLVLVIDVGAGTTDYGLYFVRTNGEGARFIEVATHSSDRAGNHLDNALSQYALRTLFGNRQDPAREAASIELQQSQRTLKEDLFTRRQVRLSLQAGYRLSVDLDGFRREADVVDFERQLRAGIEEVFTRAERAVAKDGESIDWTRYPTVRVVLTGGGATLPMVREIASQPLQPYRNPGFEHERCTVQCEVSTQLPQRVRASGVDEAGYLPLAVAWGGAMPELPIQGKPVGLATVRPPGGAPPVAAAVIPPAETWMNRK
ncbi:MAG: hypothetical protein U0324_37120 [Polyangiales bacterium]